ncbi:MAG: hypothetical protein CMM93_00615 [Rickettsiales bacterium]|mgnify:CR=1 FL=1|nr:hypothetical protein [Rickettsiales bacterium]|tara:strand:- start:212 stop:898 length:687 start_codon:yes stop_codon:yes gene_type:complete
MTLTSRFKHFLRAENAASLIEFAITFPVLLLLFLGSVEISRYIIIQQKVEKSSYTIADLVTRYSAATSNPAKSGELDQAEVDTVLATLDDLMDPFDAGENAVACISSVQRVDTLNPVPTVRWQAAGGGTLSTQGGQTISSNVNNRSLGSINSSVRNSASAFSGEIADAFAFAGPMQPNENVIIVEVWYQFELLLGQTWFLFNDGIIKSNAFFAPRNNDVMRDLPPDFV